MQSDSYKVVEIDEANGKIIFDLDFFKEFFIKDPVKSKKTLTTSAIKVGAYLLTVLCSDELKKLPMRKDISEAAGISTKSVIEALNLLVAANFLIRQTNDVEFSKSDPGEFFEKVPIITTEDINSESKKIDKNEIILSRKNNPKYSSDLFKINPSYNIIYMEKYREFITKKQMEEVSNEIRKSRKFRSLINFSLKNPELIEIFQKQATTYWVNRYMEEENKNTVDAVESMKNFNGKDEIKNDQYSK